MKKYGKGIALVLMGLLAALLLFCASSCSTTRKSMARNESKAVSVEDTLHRTSKESDKTAERRVTVDGTRTKDSILNTDSVTVRDSVRVRQNESGGYDTERTRYVVRVKLVDHIQYKDRWIVDSTALVLLREQLDSVSAVNRTLIDKETKVAEVKEKEMPWWERLTWCVGAGLVVLFVVLSVRQGRN